MSTFLDRLKANLGVALPYLPRTMWLALAGIFGVIGYKLYALGLQQAGRAVIEPATLSTHSATNFS
jgi:hypothetical protein